MELNIALLQTPSASSGTMEIVERKGKGHPDTLCDALAEELSIALCRFYRERFPEYGEDIKIMGGVKERKPS